MLRKYDRYARKSCFTGQSAEEFEAWRQEGRGILSCLLGLEKMEESSLHPVTEESILLPEGIRREHIRIQTEPDVWMSAYLLIPADAGPDTRLFLCLPGHGGGGKDTVSGAGRLVGAEEAIRKYNYDYGRQMAELGYVAVCPDCRGFGERRESGEDMKDPELVLKGDCYWLAHMGEPLGIPVAGMLVWDLMRLLDYLEQRGQWDTSQIGCMGFSGGGMQTLWLAAMDDRVRCAAVSGYLYGYRDSLLILNRNCSCNYVPHLWEHFDMGDIASMIAPRPLWIQSCLDDRLNGPRGIVNAEEQVEIVRKAYRLYGREDRVFHEICGGSHQWHGEHLKEYTEKITK